MRDRLRRVTDLFVQGKTLSLPDGTLLWIQVLNPYERDECISDAQVARSRLIMAMKAAGNERLKVEARLLERGRDDCISDLAQVKADSRALSLTNEIQDDPEWRERLEILRRTDFENSAKPPTQEELELVEKINRDFFDELTQRSDAERDYQVQSLQRLSDEELVEEYADAWMDRRAGEVGSAEYELGEIWYATRFCDGATKEGGDVDHTACGTHEDRVFENKADARSAPEGLTEIIKAALQELAMGPRDPKDSGSPQSSSDSPPPPSEPEGSTPSTSSETPDAAPGTSPQQ